MDHEFSQMAAQAVVLATNAAIEASSATTRKQPVQPQVVEPNAAGPTAAEEALAQLFILHGKQFAAAASISHYSAEPILRLTVPSTGRFLFQVGPYYVLAPPAMYCSCSAFHFGMVTKQSSWGCKHILAVQLALQQDARVAAAQKDVPAPPVQQVLSTLVADDGTTPRRSILDGSEATPVAVPRKVLPSAAQFVSLTIREKSITEDEFANILAA